MTFHEWMNLVLTHFPDAVVEPDNDGQLVIYTNLQLVGHPTYPEGESIPLEDCIVEPMPEI